MNSYVTLYDNTYVQLATDTKDVSIEIEDIPDFTVDENTRALPQLKGSGLVYDSFIAVLTCKDFKANKSLHVRMKIKHKGARHGAQQRVA